MRDRVRRHGEPEDGTPVGDDLFDSDLVRAARAGDDTAFELLLRRYDHVVRMRARRYFLQGAEYEDLVQEGMIGLFKAVRDYREGTSAFRTFADLCITRQIITAIKAASRLKHTPLNGALSLEAPRYDEEGRTLGDTLGTPGLPPDLAWLRSQEVARVLQVLRRHLSPFEFKVLMLWLDGQSYEEVACGLGRHTKSVDNALWRVKCKVRRLLASGKLPA
jgi:RNA polymerase sporulation-specific sigma factor